MDTSIIWQPEFLCSTMANNKGYSDEDWKAIQAAALSDGEGEDMEQYWKRAAAVESIKAISSGEIARQVVALLGPSAKPSIDRIVTAINDIESRDGSEDDSGEQHKNDIRQIQKEVLVIKDKVKTETTNIMTALEMAHGGSANLSNETV